MTEAIGVAQPRFGAIKAMFSTLIRLHEVVHRCAYPVSEPDDETHRQRLNDLAGKTAEFAAQFHPCRPDLDLVMASRIEAIIEGLNEALLIANRGSLQSHLIELERDVRALAGVIATAHA
jgi:hypothetical protein